jgi:hypothetical protein
MSYRERTEPRLATWAPFVLVCVGLIAAMLLIVDRIISLLGG